MFPWTGDESGWGQREERKKQALRKPSAETKALLSALWANTSALAGSQPAAGAERAASQPAGDNIIKPALKAQFEFVKL